MKSHYDVVIVGGGPGGSTTGSLLMKYRPQSEVLILEREKFPREHVGESQLPVIGGILNEMGVWDKVESANFPIKLGGTFLWGRTAELWDFNFIPIQNFKNEPRPAKYEGQRVSTAFQVDRAIYDDILLRHAESLGCEVREETAVRQVDRDGDRITGLTLGDGSRVTAKHYIDSSGNAAVLRRGLGVEIDCPTKLKNIAMWDYWTNAEWAEEIGVGGTRIQVLTVGFGWLWFIPLGPTRTSIGLVCPVEYYKSSGKTPEELYTAAIAASPRISGLIRNASRENIMRTTNDWSYVAQRTTGENWMLVGETAGFADPILSAGLTLTHVGGREAAYTLKALLDGQHDPAWLKHHYHENQTRRIRQHMRFADFWYSANGQFTDLQEHCRDIAREAGLTLSAKEAWAWLAQGGFTNDFLGQANIGGFEVAAIKHVTELFTNEKSTWELNGCNVFRLNLDGATQEDLPYCEYPTGAIRPIVCFLRDGHRLPVIGVYGRVFRCLKLTADAQPFFQWLAQSIEAEVPQAFAPTVFSLSIGVLETLISEGWVQASIDASKPRLEIGNLTRDNIRSHEPYVVPA